MELENKSKFTDIINSIRDAVEAGSITNDMIAEAFDIIKRGLEKSADSDDVRQLLQTTIDPTNFVGNIAFDDLSNLTTEDLMRFDFGDRNSFLRLTDGGDVYLGTVQIIGNLSGRAWDILCFTALKLDAEGNLNPSASDMYRSHIYRRNIHRVGDTLQVGPWIDISPREMSVSELEMMSLAELEAHVASGNPYVIIEGANCRGTAQIIKANIDPVKYCLVLNTTYLPTNGAFADNGSMSIVASETPHTFYCIVYEQSLIGRVRTNWRDRLDLITNELGTRIDSLSDGVDDLYETVKTIPTEQTSPDSSMGAGQYIFSNGLQHSVKCVLTEMETKIYQDGGKLMFRKGAWGQDENNRRYWSTRIPIASASADGAMSKEDKVKLDGLGTGSFTDALKNQLLNASGLFGKLHEDANGNVIEWNSSHNANGFVTAGTYRIKGQRTNNADNLPLGNVGSGHTIDGLLYVFDSSLTSGTGQTDDMTITQLLVLSNRVGGQEGGQWIRSGYGVNPSSLTWKPWAKMQTNMEVGVVNDGMQLMDSAGNQTLNASLGMNSLVDNGIYSGAYIPGNGTSLDIDTETFVMVVINNYAVAGVYKAICQIKLGLVTKGEFQFKRRLKLSGGWTAWTAVATGGGSILVQ